MLERLGEVLKKATDKIANAIFLDKSLVDSIVRDLQRALIEADVNIVLVKQISDKIKKSALDERMKGVDKKEHVIKLLHDELVKILGKYEQIKLKKGQNRIMLLGLYGAGKCVHENTNIQLSDGDILPIKNIYNKYQKNFQEKKIKDGQQINIEKGNLLVPSYNPKTQKIENKRATHIWKLKKEELIEVTLADGNNCTIKVTPEHPFFTLNNGKIKQVRADNLNENSCISIPNTIITQAKTISLSDKIQKLNLLCLFNPEDAKKIISNKKENIKKLCKRLNHTKNYCHLTTQIKKGILPIEIINLKKLNLIKIKAHNSSKIITMPLYLNSDLSEFIGYVVGDGHIEKNYIEISNEDQEIIQRVSELSKILFNINPTIKKDPRTKNLHNLRLCSSTLVEIFKIFELTPGKKGKNLKIPKEILISNNDVLKSFIRAYFDCDSSPSKNNRHIELTSESEIIIQQLNMLLKRFGILSAISKKIVNNVPYWRLYIKAKYAEKYANKIGYLIKRKNQSCQNYETIGAIQGSGNQDMIPLGKILKSLRLQMGFSIGEIQTNAVYSYGIYEKKGIISREKLKILLKYYQIKKRGIIWNFLNDVLNNNFEKYSYSVLNGMIHTLKKDNLILTDNGQILLTQKSKQLLKLINTSQIHINVLINSLTNIANSEICWIPLKNIKKIKNTSKYVYDLTVEDNHSFIAENFIIHNTTSIAKLGNYYAKRGHKIALLGLDVHRPAAKEQLKQLGKQNKLNVFVDLEENNALKTWKKFKPELKKYDLVLIDTAGRHTLDDELITEIKDLGKNIKPTETILVMPADIGQAAKQQAEEFKKTLNITGVIITRMDSTAKGGGALTACAETDASVYFIATGEKINDIEEFDPQAFLSRLLGMGDLGALIEKIRSVTDEGQQEEMQQRLAEGKISLEDVIEQVKSMSSLGGLDKIKSLIPGLGKAKIPENALGNQEAKIAKWEHILKSMTKEEKENPDILEKQPSRITRIAKGTGVNKSDIKSLLKQYKMLSSMIKEQASFDTSKPMDMKQMQKMMKKFGKMKF